MPLNLDYFYGNEAEQYSFYRIPKILFTDPGYKTVSVEAKVLYGLLLDRMGLSVRNGWLDECKRVYIYFTLEDAQDFLRCGHNKAVSLFGELDKAGLIERKKQGQGKPTKIYVKNFVCKEEVKTSENRKSALPETGSQDFPKSDANNTDKKNTEMSDTESIYPPSPPEGKRRAGAQRRKDRMDMMDSYRALIHENIDYDILLLDNPYDQELIDGYVELMLEVCCSQREYTRVNQDQVPTEVVKSRLLKLDKEHISYVLDSLKKNTTLVGNIKAYTLSALYNAPVTIGQYYASLVSHDMAQGFGNK